MSPTEAGVGAWRIPDDYYERGLPLTGLERDPGREAWHRWRVGVTWRGVSTELRRRGYLEDADPAKLHTWGPLTQAAVEVFQFEAGLTPDGRWGPRSSMALWLPVIAWWQQAMGIPSFLLGGLLHHESGGLDTGAEGYVDRNDRGIAQFNRIHRSDVSDERAFGDPRWCIQQVADELAANERRYRDAARFPFAAGRPTTRWNCAVAWHNHHVYADGWAKAGQVHPRVATYVASVRERAARF